MLEQALHRRDYPNGQKANARLHSLTGNQEMQIKTMTDHSTPDQMVMLIE